MITTHSSINKNKNRQKKSSIEKVDYGNRCVLSTLRTFALGGLLRRTCLGDCGVLLLLLLLLFSPLSLLSLLIKSMKLREYLSHWKIQNAKKLVHLRPHLWTERCRLNTSLPLLLCSSSLVCRPICLVRGVHRIQVRGNLNVYPSHSDIP